MSEELKNILMDICRAIRETREQIPYHLPYNEYRMKPDELMERIEHLSAKEYPHDRT